MTFTWPLLLWTLLLLPLLVAFYVWLLRRRKKNAVAFANLALVRQAATRRSTWKRHVPPALMLVALGLMLVAAARPVAVVHLPSNKQTIMLAMDVSGSMRATDVEPSRIVAAQNAAKAFLNDLPRHVRVGIVAFAGTAQLAQLPTLSREDLVTAIDRFQLQRGTATGNGIVLATSLVSAPRFKDKVARLGGGSASGELAIERLIRGHTPSIRRDGIDKVLKGQTSLEEVLRVTRED